MNWHQPPVLRLLLIFGQKSLEQGCFRGTAVSSLYSLSQRSHGFVKVRGLEDSRSVEMGHKGKGTEARVLQLVPFSRGWEGRLYLKPRLRSGHYHPPTVFVGILKLMQPLRALSRKFIGYQGEFCWLPREGTEPTSPKCAAGVITTTPSGIAQTCFSASYIVFIHSRTPAISRTESWTKMHLDI